MLRSRPIIRPCSLDVPTSRREFLARAGGGCGMLALAGLLQQEQARANWTPPDSSRPMAPRVGHHPAKAKNVIWLFINGGPSHVDTWDYKPELQRSDGQEIPGFDRDTVLPATFSSTRPPPLRPAAL